MMRIFNMVAIMFYAGVIILIGIGLIALSFNLLLPEHIDALNYYMQDNQFNRWAVRLSGLLVVIISYWSAQMILGRMQREKTIAFMTASGEVTIALSAIEDLIKHTAFHIPEIKDLNSDVIATKKGIVVNMRVTLRSEANLPELTARLQEITKNKIQEVLGLEEAIIIKIHISKIVQREDRDKKRKEAVKEEPAIPFGGFGRV
ncbi:MAG: alkaline shock response membrane anchor protein AmaP [Candidatus Omnitrophica bacterium]|nr:alkaline shock response membrane anchor protein AmaP [Candidatus Omnitrophota bacterium]MDD4940937.1 alkaline shock response membrane anchor protein AmaP [Candidatus Omnitrophota bacterium]